MTPKAEGRGTQESPGVGSVQTDGGKNALNGKGVSLGTELSAGWSCFAFPTAEISAPRLKSLRLAKLFSRKTKKKHTEKLSNTFLKM